MSLCDRLKTRFMIETPGMLALRGYSMSLLIRINLALGAVFIAAALIAGYACRSILEANAQREVFVEAGLMMDSALAIRAYTANEILPLLSEQIQEAFPPQSGP